MLAVLVGAAACGRVGYNVVASGDGDGDSGGDSGAADVRVDAAARDVAVDDRAADGASPEAGTDRGETASDTADAVDSDPDRPLGPDRPADVVADMTTATDLVADTDPGPRDQGSDGCVSSAEICDGLDNDCSGTPDDMGACRPGCTGRLHNGHAYMFCPAGAIWAGSRSACASFGMRLVRIDDNPERIFVLNTALPLNGGDWWLGGHDTAAEGVWRWEDGAQFWMGAVGGMPVGGLYTRWATSEPNGGSSENCLEIYSTGGWNDKPCASSNPFVCERY